MTNKQKAKILDYLFGAMEPDMVEEPEYYIIKIKNNTPWLNCMKIDKEWYEKIQKYDKERRLKESKKKILLTICGYAIPSKHIKASKTYVNPEGFYYIIDACDYGWVITTNYETYSSGYKNKLGYKKNFEEAYKKIEEMFKTNEWPLKEKTDFAEEIVEEE